MVMNKLSKPTRRGILLNTGILAAGWELSCTDAVLTQELAPTPACRDGDEPTVRETEGPFFKPRSPERSDLRVPGAGGRPLELSGFVLTRRRANTTISAFDIVAMSPPGSTARFASAPSCRSSIPAGPGTITSGSLAGQPSAHHATVFPQRTGERA
jgi:hypothetical protein